MQKKYSSIDFKQFDREYRRTFMNSLTGFKSVHLLGTTNKNGIPNLALISSVFHIGANPPFIGLCFRPERANGHSFENIIRDRYFTLNVVNENIIEQSHKTSTAFSEKISEFDECRFTALYENKQLVPFVAESLIRCLVEYKEHYEVRANQTRIVVGEIKEVQLDSDFIESNGYILHQKAKSVVVNGLEGYHKTEEIIRLGFQKCND